MDIPLTNVQQLFDAITSTWIKIAEECFQQLFESVLQRIKSFPKAKWIQSGTSKIPNK